MPGARRHCFDQSSESSGKQGCRRIKYTGSLLAGGEAADHPGRPVEPVEQGRSALALKGPARGLPPSPHSRSVPGYGRDPVGNGQAAAGFSAVRALGIAALVGGVAGAVTMLAAGLATGSAGLADAFFFLGFFFLAAFFLPAALLATFFFEDFFFLDAFFFFFFLAAFFLPFFFVAIAIS
jgi:hypothetical protein